MIGVHLLIAHANRQVPPHLSLLLFWGVFGSGLTFVVIWLWVMLRRFRRDTISSCGWRVPPSTSDRTLTLQKLCRILQRTVI